MQEAEALKQKGNKCFSDGDIDQAVAVYQEAINLLLQRKKEQTEKRSAQNIIDPCEELFAVLYSNLSNVFLVKSDYGDSWRAAEQSTVHDPTFAKAWLRYIEARRMDGYPFEAFVTLLWRLRPLLRSSASSTSSKRNVGDIRDVEASLYNDLGLSKVLPHIELEEYESGVGIVAQKAVKPNDIILVERRFETSFAELDLGSQSDLTTVSIAAYFAEKMYPHQRAQSEVWIRFNKQFKGCWPRHPEDISMDTRKEISSVLRDQFAEMTDEDFEALFNMAVMCRYNCFHSGFFRACALANHSCRANAAMKYNPQDETVTLIAVRPISPGEFVNVKYVSDARFLMGLGKRRDYLRSWLFWCKCERCYADNENSATQEQIQCRHCLKYTHLPLQGDNTETSDTDPLLVSEKPCIHCGRIVEWSPESRAIVTQLMTSFSTVAEYTSYDKLTMWLLGGLRQISFLRVHPDHWLYRILLYFFCVPMTNLVNAGFDQFTAIGWSSPSVEELLRDFGIRHLYSGSFNNRRNNRNAFQPACGRGSEDYNRNKAECGDTVKVSAAATAGDLVAEDPFADMTAGGDVLYALCILWHLISPFYPEYEGWALHRAICRLVLVSHINPNESAALPESHALTLLRRHGKYIGSAEASVWMHTYNRFKPTSQRKGLLSIKQIKNAFQS